MSESATTNEIDTAATPVMGLQLLGDAEAASCVGDVCEIPDHHSTVVVNRRLDDDAV